MGDGEFGVYKRNGGAGDAQLDKDKEMLKSMGGVNYANVYKLMGIPDLGTFSACKQSVQESEKKQPKENDEYGSKVRLL